MGYAEEIFERAEYEVESIGNYDGLLDWLRKDKNGNIVRRETEKIKTIARDLARPFEIIEGIDSASSLSEIDKFASAKDSLSFYTDDVQSSLDSKRNEILNNILEELNASTSAKTSIKRYLEANNYDLKTIKWHSFSVKGRPAVGIWSPNKGRFITWFFSERPSSSEVSETTNIDEGELPQ